MIYVSLPCVTFFDRWSVTLAFFDWWSVTLLHGASNIMISTSREVGLYSRFVSSTRSPIWIFFPFLFISTSNFDLPVAFSLYSLTGLCLSCIGLSFIGFLFQVNNRCWVFVDVNVCFIMMDVDGFCNTCLFLTIHILLTCTWYFWQWRWVEGFTSNGRIKMLTMLIRMY